MARPIKVLIAEDDPGDAELLVKALRRAGFEPAWTRVDTEAAYVEQLVKGVDLVLSDYRMPEFSALRALELLTQSALGAPFIIVSGTIGEETAVEAMKLGATDYLLKDRLGRLGSAVARALDSSRLRAESRRAEMQLRLQGAALASAGNSIVITDSGGTILWTNPAFTALTGYTSAEAAGQSTRMLKSGEQDAAFYRDLWKTILAGQTWRGEFVNRRKDGSVFIGEQTITPVRSDKGDITHFIGITNDVTAERRASEALRQSHEQLRQLLDYSPAVLYSLKLQDGKVVPYLVSENITRFLGFMVEDTLSNDWWLGHLHPEDRELAVASVAETLEKELSVTEYRLRHKNGGYIWVEDKRRLIRDATGAPAELSGVWSDITERKRAEGVLRESERRFREMLENLELIAMTLDKRGIVTFCNDYLLRLTGWTREEVVGADWFERFIPAANPEVKKVFFDNIKHEAIPVHFENPIRTKGGELRDIVWSNTLLRDEGGRVTGTASIGEDVTDRRHAEAELRQSEERFRKLAENINEVFWMTNAQKNQMLYVSPAYEKIWGRTCKDLYADPKSWVEAIHPEDRERVMQAAMTRQASGAYDEEYRIVRPDGTVRWIHDRASPVRDESGEVSRIVGVAEDITGRRHLEEQFRQAQKMEAIGTLAGGIAHDFNNILSVIGGYTELLKESLAGDPRSAEKLEAVSTATERATKLVRQILTFSRQQKAQRQPMRLAPAIEEAVKFLRATIPSTIEIRADLAADAPDVLADSTQVHQILMNLGTNAWHAMKDRPGILEVKLEGVDIDHHKPDLKTGLQPGRYARLSVSDTGTGMDPVTLGRIFEPFFTTKPVGEGTGLGLAVVHGIMQSHDGAITVQSQPGKGTVFQAYFPAYSSTLSVVETRNVAIPRGHGERILYVDDEIPLAWLGKETLEHLGYVVESQTNVAEALAIVHAEPGRFDLVVTDQTMPIMTGIDFARELGKIRRNLPIILTTGYTWHMTRESLRATGIRELLLKPPTMQSLGTLVHRVLAEATPKT